MPFTLVFDGDIRKLPANPFLTDTPFGRPVAAAAYDALERLAELEIGDIDAPESVSRPSEPMPSG